MHRHLWTPLRVLLSNMHNNIADHRVRIYPLRLHLEIARAPPPLPPQMKVDEEIEETSKVPKSQPYFPIGWKISQRYSIISSHWGNIFRWALECLSIAFTSKATSRGRGIWTPNTFAWNYRQWVCKKAYIIMHDNVARILTPPALQ